VTTLKERKGKERKGKERKGKERKGKERKGKRSFRLLSAMELVRPFTG